MAMRSLSHFKQQLLLLLDYSLYYSLDQDVKILIRLGCKKSDHVLFLKFVDVASHIRCSWKQQFVMWLIWIQCCAFTVVSIDQCYSTLVRSGAKWTNFLCQQVAHFNGWRSPQGQIMVLYMVNGSSTVLAQTSWFLCIKHTQWTKYFHKFNIYRQCWG